MQLGTTAESLDDVTGAASIGPAGMGPAAMAEPESGAEDDTPTHDAAASEPPPPPALPSERPRPPPLPVSLLASVAGSAHPAPAQIPSPRDLDFELGAPLLPERAHDPHYYPGISDEPPPQPIAPLAVPVYKSRLALGVGGGALLVLLVLIVRGLFAAPRDTALVVDVNPADARVTLDGEPLAATSGPRRRTGMMNGEHVLAAERSGFVSERRVFTYDADRGDRRMVLALKPEPPPPTAAAPTPEAAAPEPAPEMQQASAPPAEEGAIAPLSDKRASARELAKQRRQERIERIRARRAARETNTAVAAVAATSAAPKAGKSGPPALLKLNSVPWAEVYIDKRHVGHTPLIGFQMTPGRHVIRLQNPSSRASKTLRIKAAAGETVTQLVKL